MRLPITVWLSQLGNNLTRQCWQSNPHKAKPCANKANGPILGLLVNEFTEMDEQRKNIVLGTSELLHALWC